MSLYIRCNNNLVIKRYFYLGEKIMVANIIEIFLIQFLIALNVILFAAPIIKAPKTAIYKTLGIVGTVMMFSSIVSVMII